MADAKVSVIIPTYNRASLLPRAIDSVLNQTTANLTLIVVDDASTDGTGDIVQEYADPRIEYIRHDENRGPNQARNTGLKAAESEFIALLDDDDEWLEDKLRRQIDRFGELDPSYGLVITGREVIKDGRTIEEYIPTLEGRLYKALLRKNFIPSETPLIRKRCFDTVGSFDPKLESSQDWDMWLRIAREFKVANVPEVLARSYWDTHERISDDSAKKCQGKRLIFRKYFSDIMRDPIALYYSLSRIGYYCTVHRFTSSRTGPVSSFLED